MSFRILIADDAPQVRRVLKWVLESHSRNWKICAEAVDGLQAIEKALETKPELIILDLRMPQLDGLSASTKISELLPEIPIMLFTLHKSARVDLEAKQAGVREVISKSDAAALVAAIEKMMSENPKPPPAATGTAPA